HRDSCRRRRAGGRASRLRPSDRSHVLPRARASRRPITTGREAAESPRAHRVHGARISCPPVRRLAPRAARLPDCPCAQIHGGRTAGMGTAVVHFEIGAADDQPLVAFYGQLFGWGMNPMPEGGYTLIDTRGGGGINGGIGRSQTGEPWSTFYVEADELQAGLPHATSPGATT